MSSEGPPKAPAENSPAVGAMNIRNKPFVRKLLGGLDHLKLLAAMSQHSADTTGILSIVEADCLKFHCQVPVDLFIMASFLKWLLSTNMVFLVSCYHYELG